MKHMVEMDKLKNKEEGQSFGSQSMDAKSDLMTRMMEKLVNIISLEIRLVVKEPREPQVRIPNYRLTSYSSNKEKGSKESSRTTY